ncbi:MAG: DUF2628 domain-containing protein [Bradyrhizobiaceae bacterium]|nr:MAG: DUF2628 domain-containing protein [Bradyrhizobiaceae bacterium]
MAVYTVHAPASFGVDVRTTPDRIVFIRDGFYFWAFVAGLIWLVWHRLWLATLGYVVLVVLTQIVLTLLAVSSGAEFVVFLLIAALLGLEAGSLWRWTLRRRKWRELGVVVARNEREAEQRFFESFSNSGVPLSRGSASSLHPLPRSSITEDATGFFPSPGVPR